MIRLAIIASTALVLTGCDLLERATSATPSPERVAQLASWTPPTPAPALEPPMETGNDAGLVDVPDTHCLPQYMVRRCGPDGAEPW